MRILKRCTIILVVVAFVSCAKQLQSQSGVQLLTEDALEGYTLAYGPQQTAYLIDNCGEIVNQWSMPSGIDQKLTRDGTLLHADRERRLIYETSWDGQTETVYNLAGLNLLPDYDQIKMPNGNMLSKALRPMTSEELDALGYDLDMHGGSRYADVIIEINRESEVVWEWNPLDHVIQQRDSTKANYGIVADHPELINLDARPAFNWRSEIFMINGFDYNEELDQIAVSLRLFCEIVIVDHSTTAEESKGHTGGRLGRGGDIAYRWGNPANYGRATVDDQFLFFQHYPNWIKYGEHKGKLIVFNNGLRRPGRDYSDVPIIAPPMDSAGNYIIEDDHAFGPVIPDLVINEEANLEINSDYTSSADVLSNGNFLITAGSLGRILELSPDLEPVWDFFIPNGYPFRTYKYDLAYQALDGRDLTPSGKMPGDNSNYPCDLTTSTHEIDLSKIPQMILMSNEQLKINAPSEMTFTYQIFTADGRLCLETSPQYGENYIDIAHLSTGLYLLRAYSSNVPIFIGKFVVSQD